MKNLFFNISISVIFLFIGQKFIYADYCDTTFKASLFETGKNNVKISFQCDEWKNFTGVFTINVDGKYYSDSTQSSFDFFEAKVVDVDKDDDYREIAICTFLNEGSEYKLYRFTGKKIIFLGDIATMGGFVFPGDGTILANVWMGFWSYEYKYNLNKSKMKYEPEFEDEYSLNLYEGYEEGIIVKESFNTFKSRDKESNLVTKFKPGDKIIILKAYIKVKCETDYIDPCVWYLIKDREGNEGWLQLKDFQDKVEGIIWAG